jgi:predicted RNase H-like HicB family nuclease
MTTVKIVYWQDGGMWLGYLADYPDYWTQGETLEDLKEHLIDLYRDLSGGHIPGARKVEELAIPRSGWT